MFSLSNRIPACDRQTDGRRDAPGCDGIVRAMHTRRVVKPATHSWNLTEQDQCNATKRLKGFSMLHYCERLNKLEAEALEMRRLKLDLVMYSNILHGFVDIDAGSLFDTINCNVIRSCGHPLRIIKQHCIYLSIYLKSRD